MVSKNNKNLTVKVNKNTYEFLKLFSEKYKCSIASLCQHLIMLSINQIDLNQSVDDTYYKRLSYQIRNNYDERRKI